MATGTIFGDVSIIAVGAVVAITVIIIAVTALSAKYFSTSVDNVARPAHGPYPGTFSPPARAAARAAASARANALGGAG
jgi:hypothetical protein